MAGATPDLQLPFQLQDIAVSLTGTKLYCLVTEAHVCEQLANDSDSRTVSELVISQVAGSVSVQYQYL